MVVFDTIASLCSAVPVLRSGLLAGLFAAGAAGSVMHCGPMCGGFVLGQVSDRLTRLPAARLCEAQRVRAGLVLPYHLGRLTTYAALGALMGRLSGLSGVAPYCLLGGAVLFALFAVRRLAWLERAPVGWGRLVGRVARRVPSGHPLSEYATGVALGFLPCGFLYAALTVAAASGDPLLGAAGMLAFGAGTVPVLAAIGIAGQAAGRRWHVTWRRIAPAVMAVNAMLLLAMAWRALA